MDDFLAKVILWYLFEIFNVLSFINYNRAILLIRVGVIFRAPTGNIHPTKNSQGIQKMDSLKWGIYIFFLCRLPFPSFYFQGPGWLLTVCVDLIYADLTSLSLII